MLYEYPSPSIPYTCICFTISSLKPCNLFLYCITYFAYIYFSTYYIQYKNYILCIIILAQQYILYMNKENRQRNCTHIFKIWTILTLCLKKPRPRVLKYVFRVITILFVLKSGAYSTFDNVISESLCSVRTKSGLSIDCFHFL